MRYTLADALEDVASFINQDPSQVTGTDLTSQANLIRQSESEWADYYQWSQLRQPYVLPIAASMASVGLPNNFKKAMSPMYDVASNQVYMEIRPEERFTQDTASKYFCIFGNDPTGKYMLINPAAGSGASLMFDYQFAPSAAATLTNYMNCPSRPFIAARTISKILEARSDPRYPIKKAESDGYLDGLVEEEASPSGAETGEVKNYYKRSSFRIGA